MKKNILILVSVFTLTVLSAKAAKLPTTSNTLTNESYIVNDEQIEALFASSEDITATTINSLTPSTQALQSTLPATNTAFASVKGSGKSAIVAILIDFFIGGLGIHRAYLGTKTFTWIGYILTCGGIFGIVPFVDLIVLIVNAGDISKYEDNTKFFMW